MDKFQTLSCVFEINEQLLSRDTYFLKKSLYLLNPGHEKKEKHYEQHVSPPISQWMGS